VCIFVLKYCHQVSNQLHILKIAYRNNKRTLKGKFALLIVNQIAVNPNVY